MTDYKKTINIPKTNFPMKADLSLNSEKFSKFWEENQIYKKIKEKNKNKKKFILHDGPPYANGNIHVGHALNKILKDFVCRYKSATNYFVEYIPGWDTHGLPIENKIEKTKSDFKIKNLLEKRKYCREYALEQIELQKSQFKKLHLFSDLSEKYITLSSEYIKNEYEILLDFFAKNAIVWDLKPVSWSWSSQTALADSEIVYKNIEENSIYFAFEIETKIKNFPSKVKALIWTTTPYTLEANQAISFSPEISYVLFLFKDEYFLIAKNRYHILEEIFDWKKCEIISEWKGEDFEHAEYINPLTNEKNFAILADYITDDSGTGIVHNAPGFGLEDYFSALKYKLNVYCPINEKGYFVENTKFQPIKNLFYTDASKIVIDYLKTINCIVKIEKINHNVGHDWRTEKPLIYRATRQWFLNLKKIKHEIKNILKKLDSYPSWVSKKLEELLLNRNEWCLSRQRAWGVPIPIIFCNSEPILEIEQISHTIKLLNQHGLDIWYEKPAEFFLKTKAVKNKEYKKSTDILDVWFDSGTSWKTIKDESQYADLYLEGFDQLRGWFNSSAIISIFNRKSLPFKKIVAHGFVLDEKGNKMSKSLGNVVDPLEIVEKFGADILRLWIAKSNYFEDLKFSEESIKETIILYRKIRNTLFRYPISVVSNFEFSSEKLSDIKYPENLYILKFFREKYKKIKNLIENFNFSTAMLNISIFLKIYSSWYLEITKDILYCSEKTDERYIEICTVIYEILQKSIKIFSIFIPQTSEEAYQYLDKKNKKESVFLEDWDEKFSEKSKKEESEIKLPDFQEFLKIKNNIYSQTEKLKEEKKISGSWEACIEISENLIKNFQNLDLKYMFNVAEIKIDKNSENRISAVISNLEKCKRCKKHKEKSEFKNDDLCVRCFDIVEKIEIIDK